MGVQPCVVPPDRPCFHLGLSLIPEVLSTLDYWCCRFSMIKLVDIAYSEHQIFAYHYLHRNLLSAHMPATSAAGAGKERALKLNPLFLLFFPIPGEGVRIC